MLIKIKVMRNKRVRERERETQGGGGGQGRTEEEKWKSFFEPPYLVPHRTQAACSSKQIKQIIDTTVNIIFIIHSVTGISVTMDVENNVFDAKTFAMLVISCGTSLLYAALMSYTLSVKLNIMNYTRGYTVFFTVVGLQLLLKLASFLIVFYILAAKIVSSNSTFVDGYWLDAFMTPLGYAGMYVNLVANQLYTDFIAVVLVLVRIVEIFVKM